jgi:hypothetical protein
MDARLVYPPHSESTVASTASNHHRSAAPIEHPDSAITWEILSLHSIIRSDVAGWYECTLCKHADNYKRFDNPYNVEMHIQGAQHLRQLGRKNSEQGPPGFPSFSRQLDSYIIQEGEDYYCTVCKVGRMVGIDTALSHSQGKKHIKKAIQGSSRAPEIDEKWSEEGPVRSWSPRQTDWNPPEHRTPVTARTINQVSMLAKPL